jgi:hypothetical protein
MGDMYTSGAIARPILCSDDDDDMYMRWLNTVRAGQPTFFVLTITYYVYE